MARYKQKLDDIYGVKSERPSLLKMPTGKVSEWAGNSRYHEHFRGYTEFRTVDKNGRTHIERYYTSPWTVIDLPDSRYRAVRTGIAVLALLSAALYIFAMIQDIPGNRHWAVAIPGFAAIIFLILLFARVFFFCTTPRKMTLSDREASGSKLQKAALMASVIELVAGIALIVFGLVTQEAVGQTLLAGFLDILAAACSAAIWFIGKKLPYKEIPNETSVPEGESYNIR